MPIETLRQLEGTGDSRAGLYRLKSDPSNSGPFRSVEHGHNSLAVSPEDSILQWALINYLQGGWFDVAQSPLLVDTGWVAMEVQERINVQTELRAQLATKLNAAFEAEPLEDGMEHSAEAIIDEALLSTVEVSILDWLQSFCLDLAHPNFAASVLRCLGRQSCPGTKSWRTDLVRAALITDDIEIRDAAVQAAEFWGGEAIRNVLEVHSEPVHWLREYIQDVIEDLGDSKCSLLGRSHAPSGSQDLE